MVSIIGEREWLAESYRATFFLAEPVGPDGITWWSDVLRVPSDVKEVRTREGVLIEQGTSPEIPASVQLEVQPLRADWRLTPIDDEGLPAAFMEPPRLPTLGPFGADRHALESLLERIAKAMPSTKRVAFGAILLVPVEDRAEGYQLAGNISGLNLGPNASDFVFQINWPTHLVVDAVSTRINRLCKISVQRTRRVALTVGPGGPVQQQSPERYSLRMELDINTDAERAEVIPAADLPILLQEMQHIAFEISQNGPTDD